jgi:hypothetical protein
MQQLLVEHAASSEPDSSPTASNASSSSLANCAITLPDAAFANAAMPSSTCSNPVDVLKLKAAAGSIGLGSPAAGGSPLIAALHAPRHNAVSSSMGSMTSNSCSWDAVSLASCIAGAPPGSAAAQATWNASAALLHASKPDSLHMQQPLLQQLVEQQQQQQQGGMLLGCSSDAAAALQWLELQSGVPTAATAAAAATSAYPEQSGCLDDFARLSLLLQLQAQLSLNSNAVTNTSALTGHDLMRVDSSCSSLDLSGLLARQASLAGLSVVDAASSGLLTLPTAELQTLRSTGMPQVYCAAAAGMHSGHMPSAVGAEGSMSGGVGNWLSPPLVCSGAAGNMAASSGSVGVGVVPVGAWPSVHTY